MCLLLVGSHLGAAAPSVVFPTPMAWHEASLLDTTVTGELPFVVGDGVNQKTLKAWPSCEQCTMLTPLPADHPLWSQGDTGRLKYSIDLKNMTGDSRHTLSIQLDSADVSTAEIIIQLPAAFTLEPKALNWSPGEALQPKILTITPHAQLDLRATGVTCDQPDFICELLPTDGQRTFRIKVTPAKNETGSYAKIILSTDSKDPRYAQINAYVVVAK